MITVGLATRSSFATFLGPALVPRISSVTPSSQPLLAREGKGREGETVGEAAEAGEGGGPAHATRRPARHPHTQSLNRLVDQALSRDCSFTSLYW